MIECRGDVGQPAKNTRLPTYSFSLSGIAGSLSTDMYQLRACICSYFTGARLTNDRKAEYAASISSAL